MITKETVAELGRVMRDLDAGEKFLAEIDQELQKESDRIGFHGDTQPARRNCQLGWPSMPGDGYRLYNVEPGLARCVVVAHLADMKAKLVKLNEVANLESDTRRPF